MTAGRKNSARLRDNPLSAIRINPDHPRSGAGKKEDENEAKQPNAGLQRDGHHRRTGVGLGKSAGGRTVFARLAAHDSGLKIEWSVKTH